MSLVFQLSKNTFCSGGSAKPEKGPEITCTNSNGENVSLLELLKEAEANFNWQAKAIEESNWNASEQERYVKNRAMVKRALDAFYTRNLQESFPLLERGCGVLPLLGKDARDYCVSEPNKSCVETLKKNGYSIYENEEDLLFKSVVCRNVLDVVFNESGELAVKEFVEDSFSKMSPYGTFVSYHDLTLCQETMNNVELDSNGFTFRLNLRGSKQNIQMLKSILPPELKKYCLTVDSSGEFDPTPEDFSQLTIKIESLESVIGACLKKPRIKEDPIAFSLLDLLASFNNGDSISVKNIIDSLTKQKIFWKECYPIFKENNAFTFESQFEKYSEMIRRLFPEPCYTVDFSVEKLKLKVPGFSEEIIPNFHGGVAYLIGKYPIVSDIPGSDSYENVAVLKLSILRDEAEYSRLKGNEFFKQKDYNNAYEFYMKSFEFKKDPRCISNAMLAKIRLKEWSQALALTDAIALESIDSSISLKILYRAFICVNSLFPQERERVVKAAKAVKSHPEFESLSTKSKEKLSDFL